ncbi:MAG: NAD-dependent epimerase/dehydratase family protein [Actinobacteria bacterium]|nr:NAD-dependent epimerase/dehydratase family protein [Actinomycetota bacterium]
MHYLITGAGQIGSQLARDLIDDGHEVTVLRRGSEAVPGTRTISADVADREVLRDAAQGAAAIFHCIHTSYSVEAFRRDLPHRELAVMDIAAELGIPVVFPESVYAWGRGARDLGEEHPLAPASPLGQARAELLAARRAHPARTASVIASDLVGPTAHPASAVIPMLVLAPVAKGRRAWIIGDPHAPHAITYLPDLSRAMITAAPLASARDTRLMAPTAPARSQREMAADAAEVLGRTPVKVSRIPTAMFALAAPFSPSMRELYRQRYLWAVPSSMQPGRLTSEHGLEPTPWNEVLREWATAVNAR